MSFPALQGEAAHIFLASLFETAVVGVHPQTSKWVLPHYALGSEGE